MELINARQRRSRRSELLIGVFIGIYGNWLIAVVEKLGNNVGYSMVLFALSFLFLILYFQEIFGRERHFYKWWSMSTILGSIYILLVVLSLYLKGIMDSDLFFVVVGLVFWIALMQAERFSGIE